MKAILCSLPFFSTICVQATIQLDTSKIAHVLSLKPALEADSIIHFFEHVSEKNLLTTFTLDQQIAIYGHVMASYHEKVDYDSALRIYEEGIQLLAGQNRIDLETDLKAKLLLVHSGQRRFDKVLTIIHEILPYYEQEQDHKQLAHLYNTLGICYRNTSDFKLAEHNYRRSIALYEKLQEFESAALTSFNLAFLLIVQKKFMPALSILDQAERILLKEYGTYNYQIATVYIKKGECYMALNQVSKAETLYEKAVSIVRKEAISIKTARVLLDQSIFYHKTGQHEKALPILDTVLQLLRYNPNDLSQVADEPITALHALKWKYWSLYLLYNQDGNLDNLRMGYLTAKQAYDLLEEDVKGYMLGGMKDRMIRHHHNIISSLTLISHDLFHQDPSSISLFEVLSYLDRGKNLRFYEKQKTKNALRENLNRDQVSHENKLRAELGNLYTNRANSLDTEPVEIDSINRIEADIYRVTIKHDSIMARLKKTSPGYYHNALSDELDSIKLHQFICQTNTLLLDYYYVGNHSFCIAVQCDTASFYMVNGDIDSLVEILQAQIAGRSPVPQPVLDTLYEILLTFPIDSLGMPFEKLLISPFRNLSFLPFEILTINDPRKRTHVQSAPISYSYNLRSVTPLFPNPIENTFAYAPSYQLLKGNIDDAALDHVSRSGLLDLPGAQEEAQEIADLFGGKAITNAHATKANFLRTSPRADLLHLGLHAFVDHENPFKSYLLFAPEPPTEDTKLMLEDIFNLNLKARLVVLGACGTGLGNVSDGEGVSSLALAFNYVGIPASVMSLWNVPDQSTKQIFSNFYLGLRNGLDKDMALHQAKLKYLEECSEPELRHPFYWAGFIAQGDMSAVQIKSALGIYWVLIPLLLLGVFIIWKKKQKYRS